MMSKLASRKLWVAIGAAVAALFGAISGAVPWPDALQSIAAVAIGYCIAQGWVDANAAPKEVASEGE